MLWASGSRKVENEGRIERFFLPYVAMTGKLDAEGQAGELWNRH
jgi:hypothetical protein